MRVDFARIRSARLERAVERLQARLRARFPETAATTLDLRIELDASSAPWPSPEDDERYHLNVADGAITLSAPDDWGALRGLATLEALGAGGTLAEVDVEDAPRFPWRGVLLDPARHFLPVEVLERTLDGMAACKLNVLHLHLSDDQGYRLPSSRFPKLPSAEHYRVDELKALVAAAADRGIRIVPELDMPGHVTSWLAAYPEWGCGPVKASRRFGVHKACLDPSREEIYEVIGGLLEEVAEIFPDPCLHIGGDEVHPAWWSEDARVQAFMAREGLETVAALQAYFNGRVAALVRGCGRQPVAWDEIEHPTLSGEWIVQAWRGGTARDRLLNAGHSVVVSAPYYLDLHYPADVHLAFDPEAPQSELVALEDALLEDPRLRHVAGGMRWTQQWRKDAAGTVHGSGRVLGAEACLWGELVDAATLDLRLWSRLPALAELFWSSAARPADTLYERLFGFQDALLAPALQLEEALSRDLLALGVPERWQLLARLLEPVKWYGRLLGEEALAARLRGQEMPQARPYDADTPLDKLADRLPPESRPLRQLCQRAGEHDADWHARLEGFTGDLEALLQQEPAPAVLEDFVPAVRSLVEQLRRRLRGEPVTAAALDALQVPVGELMLSLPPPLRAWLLA